MKEDFNEIKTILMGTFNEDSLLKLRNLITKLNNPVYYKKRLYLHPINKLGYKSPRNTNIWLNTIREFKDILANRELNLDEKKDKLQIAYAWWNNSKDKDTYVKQFS